MRRPPGEVRIRRGARIPRMPWQGAGENNRAQRNKESVFPSARPHLAGSGECGALAASAGGDGRRRGAFANPAGVAPDIPGALVASAVGGAIPPAFSAADFSAVIIGLARRLYSKYRPCIRRISMSVCGSY